MTKHDHTSACKKKNNQKLGKPAKLGQIIQKTFFFALGKSHIFVGTECLSPSFASCLGDISPLEMIGVSTIA
jgi:hypothetical protein